MKRVLTVDHGGVVRAMVRRFLQPHGCEVFEAVDGREGLAAVRTYRPDLVLLDVTLPGAGGRDVLTAIRADPATTHLPVVLLVAEAARGLVPEISTLGVAGCLLKPFDRPAFEQEVSKVLGPPAVPSRRPVDRRAVLVVDADQARLDALRGALGESMTVLDACSSAEAVARYGLVHPGVVVVDLALPEMDGFRTLARLEELGTSGFVALVERDDPAQREWARHVGCHGVLEKPVDARALAEHVRLAAGAVAAAETLVVEEGRCAVLQLPDPRSDTFASALPALRRALRALAGAGRDALVVDLAQVADPDGDVVGAVVGLLGDAARSGFRTALCAPAGPLAAHLERLGQTQHRLYHSRQAAREALQ